MSAASVDPRQRMDFADSPDPAAWIEDRRMAWEPGAGYRVGNEVPRGYAMNLRVSHRSRPPRDRRLLSLWKQTVASPGRPEVAVLEALVTAFGRAGGTEDTVCWFAYWRGWGGVLEENLQTLTGRKTWTTADEERAAFTLGPRDYLLLSGPLGSVLNLPGLPTPALSPQLWWPEDKRWFVATEIDFDFSLVGADEGLADAILENKEIDVQRVALEDRLDTEEPPSRLHQP